LDPKQELLEKVWVFNQSALEDSTRKTYASILKGLKTFAEQKKVVWHDPVTVAGMIMNMTEEKKSFAYIRNMVAATSRERYLTGQPNLRTFPVVTEALRAAKKKLPESKQRKPLTRKLILEITKISDPLKTDAAVRNQCILLLGMRGCLRAAEVVALNGEDVWLEKFDPSESIPNGELRKRKAEELQTAKMAPSLLHHIHKLHPNALLGLHTDSKGREPRATGIYPDHVLALCIFIASSKTKPEKQKSADQRTGTVVVVSGDSIPCLSPILWFQHWLEVARSQKVDKPDGPLFCNLEGKTKGDRLAKGSINFIVQRMVQKVLPNDFNRFGGHSLRAGGATEAARAQVEQRLIQSHGRWRSDAVRLYIHNSIGDALKLNKAVASAPIVQQFELDEEDSDDEKR
jgi:integrase